MKQPEPLDNKWVDNSHHFMISGLENSSIRFTPDIQQEMRREDSSLMASQTEQEVAKKKTVRIKLGDPRSH